MFHDGAEVVPRLLPRHAAHLKDINEVCFECELHGDIDIHQVEILKGEVIEEDVAGEQLLNSICEAKLRSVLEESTTDLWPPTFKSRLLRKRVSS